MANNINNSLNYHVLIMAGYLLPETIEEYELFNSVYPNLSANIRTGIDVERILIGKSYQKSAIKNRSISLNPQAELSPTYRLVAGKKSKKNKGDK